MDPQKNRDGHITRTKILKFPETYGALETYGKKSAYTLCFHNDNY